MKNKLQLPRLKNEDQERDFWSKMDLTDYLEKNDFQSVSFPNLKPSTRPISLRLPTYLLVIIKEQANELNIPYQSLIKKYIATGAIRERK